MRRAGAAALALVGGLILAACPAAPAKTAATSGIAASPPAAAPATPRSFDFIAPPSGDRPLPLVVLLHGYSMNGARQASYFGLTALVDAQRFVLAAPDGTVDAKGLRFWNATDACCNFFGSSVDDVAFLDRVIDQARARFRIDDRRIYLVGYSNGAFMAHRYACQRANRIAAIVSVAGATFAEDRRCLPSEPVAVLQIHGERDPIVHYEGGHFSFGPQGFPAYPSARASAARWARLDGCALEPRAIDEPVDLEARLPGAETTVERWSACAGGAVELWTIHGGSRQPPGAHLPRLQPDFAARIYEFLLAHPKR